jgi:histidinol phosphatase-like PHP family hydrolase
MVLHRRLPVCLSSDAHKPDQVGRDFSATWKRLVRMGFEEITGL